MFIPTHKANIRLFLLIILSAIIPTFIVGILTLNVSEQTLRHDTEVKLSVANTTAKKELIDWVAANKEEITYLSTGIAGITQDIQNFTQATDSKEQAQTKDLVEQDLKRFLTGHSSFFEIFLLQPSTGQVLVSTTPGQEGKLHADQPYFIQGQLHPFVQNVYYSLSLENQTITITAPVRNSQGVLLGVIAGNLNLDQLNSVLQQPAGLGKTVRSYAVNAFKLIVAGLSNDTETTYQYNQLNTLPVTEGLKGKSGVATYTTFTGKHVVGSYLPIPQLNLLVITEIDEAEILQPIQSLWFITYTTAAITLGVTLLVATYLMRLFLTSIESYRKKLEVTNSELVQIQNRLEIQNKHLEVLTHSLEIDKEHIERLLHSLNEGVIALDAEKKIWLCNTAASKILQIDKETLLEKPVDTVFKVYKDQKLVSFEDYQQKTMADHRFEIDAKLVNQDERKVIALSTAPILMGTTGQNGWVITFIDVTKEAQLESMKLDFVSIAAHELRTPLTSIRGYASLLKEELNEHGTPDQKEFVNRITLSSNNLSELIDNLLNVSRIERNTFKIETKPLDLISLIEECVNALQQQAKAKHQTLTFHKPEKSLPLVTADKFRINQVLTNLTANAINYTPEGGVVTITVQKNDTFLQVSVTDNGEGIPQEAIPKLFTKFFRVSGALEQGSKGTGLGLYITKSIITMHKGQIWVESEVNKGTTFHFTLPIATENDIKIFEDMKQNTITNPFQKGIVINTSRFFKRGSNTV